MKGDNIMKNLRNRINKFYREYDIEHPFETLTISKGDMCEYDALMTAYESLWLTMEYYEDDSAEYKWMSTLYADLGDYISYGYGGDGKAVSIFKLIASTFGTLCVGAFSAIAIEYGFDATIGCGLVLGAILAVTAGVSACQDMKGV